MQQYPIMPKGTAVWLIDNTSLTFEQIAEFCGLHILEVKRLADGDDSEVVVSFDPISSGQISREDIKICEKNSKLQLKLLPAINIEKLIKTNKSKYTPVIRRKDRPKAIMWITKYYPKIQDVEICKLLGTTKLTVSAFRNKTHRDYFKTEAHSPVSLGFCSQDELDLLISSAEENFKQK